MTSGTDPFADVREHVKNIDKVWEPDVELLRNLMTDADALVEVTRANYRKAHWEWKLGKTGVRFVSFIDFVRGHYPELAALPKNLR